ncbi:MAG: polyprenyl synthetase family protein [Roseiflexaceae bacterium]
MSEITLPPALIADLEHVEALISARASARSAVLQFVERHLVVSSERRIRAALTLLSAKLGRYDLAQVQHAAAAVELIYAATQVHDDLIDEAERRRSSVSLQRGWDGDVALMIGNYLFALAASEMALAPDPRIIAFFSRAVMAICEGQLAPVFLAQSPDEARAQYRARIGSRTAALFEAGCKAGMVCGAGDPQQVETLGHFGYELGMTVQIAADLHNLEADLRRGVITLPLIEAVAATGDRSLAEVVDLPAPDEARIQAVLAAVRSSGADARVLEQARAHSDRAAAALEPFPDSEARQQLLAIVEGVVPAG